jgi:hypothetical protein
MSEPTNTGNSNARRPTSIGRATTCSQAQNLFSGEKTLQLISLTLKARVGPTVRNLEQSCVANYLNDANTSASKPARDQRFMNLYKFTPRSR